MNPSTTRPDHQDAFDTLKAIPHQLGHRDAAQPDAIDHFPGALREAEKAAQRAHLDGLDAEQAQAASGTVNLLHRYGASGKDNIVLVPAPTADPQGKPMLIDWPRLAFANRWVCISSRPSQSACMEADCRHRYASNL